MSDACHGTSGFADDGLMGYIW